MGVRLSVLFSMMVCMVLFPLTVSAEQLPNSQPMYVGTMNSPVMTYTGWQSRDNDYDNQNVQESWQSMRTFRLMTAMKEPLRVYIDTRPSPLYKPQFAEDVEQALTVWSQALENRFTIVRVNSREEAQITVSWVTGFSDKYEAGETDATLGNADVKIKTVGLPDNIIRGNIIHELGHALGIEGHSPYSSDIMRAETAFTSQKAYLSYQPQISQRDILAIRRLYSKSWVQGEDLYRAVGREPGMVASNGSTRLATH